MLEVSNSVLTLHRRIPYSNLLLDCNLALYPHEEEDWY